MKLLVKIIYIFLFTFVQMKGQLLEELKPFISRDKSLGTEWIYFKEKTLTPKVILRLFSAKGVHLVTVDTNKDALGIYHIKFHIGKTIQYNGYRFLWLLPQFGLGISYEINTN